MCNHNAEFYTSISGEDRMLINNISDKIKICEKNFLPIYTFFLDERQVEITKKFLEQYKSVTFTFFGGFENSKRKVLGIFPEFYEVDLQDFPIKPITFTYRKTDELTHRDFLGSLMSLQIERKSIGDIIVNEGKAVIFVYNSIYKLVFESINKIGRVGVSPSQHFDETIEVKNNFTELNGTISSFRLDCIVAFITGLSREKSVSLIKVQGVELNYCKVFDYKKTIKIGDVFSIRKYGKFILFSEHGYSKKDRIRITIKKYI